LIQQLNKKDVVFTGSAPNFTPPALNIMFSCVLKFYVSTVKKVTAILFISVYLLSATEISELFKINTLVQHFYETNNTGKPVDFLHFLVMHYVTDDLNDKDNDRDRQLPFKSPETCFSNSTSLYIPFQFIQSSLAAQSFTVTKANLFGTKNDLVIIDFKNLIWHPPKYS
jgi:hypothetical protein